MKDVLFTVLLDPENVLLISDILIRSFWNQLKSFNVSVYIKVVSNYWFVDRNNCLAKLQRITFDLALLRKKASNNLIILGFLIILIKSEFESITNLISFETYNDFVQQKITEKSYLEAYFSHFLRKNWPFFCSTLS